MCALLLTTACTKHIICIHDIVHVATICADIKKVGGWARDEATVSECMHGRACTHTHAHTHTCTHTQSHTHIHTHTLTHSLDHSLNAGTELIQESPLMEIPTGVCMAYLFYMDTTTDLKRSLCQLHLATSSRISDLISNLPYHYWRCGENKISSIEK